MSRKDSHSSSTSGNSNVNGDSNVSDNNSDSRERYYLLFSGINR
jgi:hypothetical protein